MTYQKISYRLFRAGGRRDRRRLARSTGSITMSAPFSHSQGEGILMLVTYRPRLQRGMTRGCLPRDQRPIKSSAISVVNWYALVLPSRPESDETSPQVYFRSQPAQRPQSGECRITVRRETLFEDAFAEIMRHQPNDLRKRLLITFRGEEGLDYGGVSR